MSPYRWVRVWLIVLAGLVAWAVLVVWLVRTYPSY